jgi:phosphoglycolate phosphatase-like HAD superfamily hydrolase
MPTVFAFDFDGVIVDSLPIRDEGFKYAFLPYGEKVAKEAKNYHINNRGIFRLNKHKLIFKEIIGINANNDQLIATEKRFCKYVFEKLNQVKLLPGADKLEEMNGVPLYIVSAAPAEEVLKVLKNKNLNSLFSEVFGGPVDKSNHLEFIMQKHSCSPDNLIFIGDAYRDYQASMLVGCKFIGIMSNNSKSIFPSNVETYENLLQFFNSYTFSKLYE